MTCMEVVWGTIFEVWFFWRASSSSSMAAFQLGWAKTSRILWGSCGMVTEDLRELKAYFGLGLTIPLCDLVTMLYGGRGECGEWKQCVYSSETKSDCEKDGYCSCILSSI